MTAPPKTSWHLITGEYPPDHGGVADYTERIAARLAEEGCEVHVWTRGDEVTADHHAPGLTIHRVAGSFDRVGLRRMSAGLDAISGRRIVVVQYVPQAFGCRAMNVPFCFWVRGRQRTGDEVRVMFHEVRLPFFRRPLKWNIIALAQRLMAATLLRSASTIYVSTPSWIPLLRRLGLGDRAVESLPIPSNFPQRVRPDLIAAARRTATPDGQEVVGHFGTFGPSITAQLTPILARLIQERPTIRVALLGRGAAAYRRTLLEVTHLDEAAAIASEDLSPEQVTAHISAADVMLQPFPDGASFRRTSLMASLAAAVPTVTNIGLLSESVWQTQTICPATPVGDVDAAVATVRRLLADADLRRAVGRQSAAYYDQHFSLDRTIESLLRRPPRKHADLQAEQGAIADR